jgi:hypothetical protein
MGPFKRWSAVDFILIGMAALCLSLVGRYLLHSENGYVILSWIGTPLVFVGVLLLIRDRQ